MARLFVGNFDFERQLLGALAPSPALARLNAELAAVWLAAAEEGDLLLCPEPLPEPFLEQMVDLDCPAVECVCSLTAASRRSVSELIPWGWSPVLARWARRYAGDRGTSVPEGVAAVNSRHFSSGQEARFECGLPASGPIVSLEELAARACAVQELGVAGWLLKANYGQAGRERCHGEGPTPEQRVLRWAASRLRQDGVIFFEPLVEPLAEAGIQWTIPRGGRPRLDAVVLLESNPDGSFHCSRVLPGTEFHRDWDDAIAVQEGVVEEIQRRGYFGPVGIDAMRFRLPSGEIGLRPLQDVNARWTMGRLALGWAKCFSEEAGGSWVHQRHSPAGEALATSPETLGGRPVKHRTWWVSGR